MPEVVDPVPAAGSRATAPPLLLLADGRFPAGGHAHSAGVEAAIADGRVVDVATLEAYTRGRLHTAGLVDGALAAAVVLAVAAAPSDAAALDATVELDAEADARILAPPLRAASRRLGRQLVRVAARCWPASLLAGVVDAIPGGAHQPVATGVVGIAAGIEAIDVVGLVLHHTVSTPGQAAVKLLGLDPFEVVALGARLAEELTMVADAALQAARGPVADLPAVANPLHEIAAVDHGRWDVRMFAT